MNNLQIFKSEDFGEIRVTSRWDRQRGKRYFLNGMEVDRFELLAAAADADSEKRGMGYYEYRFNNISHIGRPDI